MRYVIFWTIALTVLFYITSRNANAADYSVKFGPGIEGQQLTGSTKVFGLRREAYQFYGVYTAVEVGGYVDNFGGGRKSAGLVKFQAGVAPGPETGLYGFGFFGPCFISTTDTQLGSNYQFATDVGLGIRDRVSFMTAGYGHISNAGLKLPNHGRDFLTFSIGLRF